jgi:hypothetical protein
MHVLFLCKQARNRFSCLIDQKCAHRNFKNVCVFFVKCGKRTSLQENVIFFSFVKKKLQEKKNAQNAVVAFLPNRADSEW